MARPPADDEKVFFDESFWADSAASDVSEKGKGGIIKRIITPAPTADAPKPVRHGKVMVDYRGWVYPSAEMFDESTSPDGTGRQFEFDLGKGSVIKGWDEGVATMQQGEVAVFKLAPEYAYGAGGSPPKIPANATLVFKVSLHSFTGEDISPKSDGTIERMIITEGEKYLCPIDDTPVTVDITGTVTATGKQFMRIDDLKFTVGEASEVDLPAGIDKAMVKLAKGEKCTLKLSGKQWTYQQAYKDAPAHEPITFEIHLKEFEQNSWEMDLEEKLSNAEAAKQKGNEYFAAGKFALALRRYKKIDSLLQFDNTSGIEEHDNKKKQLLLGGHLNEALCYLKLNEPAETIKHAGIALKHDPNNVKALYRRAMAYQATAEYAQAVEDCKKLIELEPSNSAAKQKMIECQNEVNREIRREQHMYMKMFGGSKTKASDSPPIPENNNEKMEHMEVPTTDAVTNGISAASD